MVDCCSGRERGGVSPVCGVQAVAAAAFRSFFRRVAVRRVAVCSVAACSVVCAGGRVCAQSQSTATATPGPVAAATADPQGSTGAKSGVRKKGRVVTISEVTIVGRIQKPIAAVDVSRIQPRLTLKELRQPFLRRIREATFRAPF